MTDHTEAVLRVALISIVFFALHSLLVTDWFKRLAARALGPRLMRGWYRFFYTALSAIILVTCLWFIIKTPDYHIYRFPWWLAWPMHGVQLAGLLFGYLSYKQIRSGEFTGTAQVRRYLRGEDPGGDIEGMTGEGLASDGGYGVVRNPLYFAGIIIFAFQPTITRNWSTVSVLAILYFIWGALIEEKRMLKRYGEDYREYMEGVPLLIPGPRALLGWLKQPPKRNEQ